jgi:Cu2+-exporting ATPase
LEAGSSHPIARAFAAERAAPAGDRHEVTGRGVEGTVAGRRYRLGSPDFALEWCAPATRAPALPGQWLLLADRAAPLCWFRLDDRLRDDAAPTVAALQRRGLRLHLLSGDRSDAVATLAAALHIHQVEAGATPERKLDYVAGLQRAGHRVLMVGDGINDIPVLAAADVSVAMSDASQLAKTSADCILLAAHLDRLPLLWDCAHKTRRIVRQNLCWALLYNGLAMPLAAVGWVPPWLAAVGMSLSSLLVVGNALRLRPRAPEI